MFVVDIEIVKKTDNVPVRSVSSEFFLVNVTTKQLHVTTTTVKLLFMLDRKLED